MEKQVRYAELNDIPDIILLLKAVGKLHGENRGDIFRGNALRYSESEIKDFIKTKKMNIFVSVNETDQVTGMVFCEFKTVEADNVLLSSKTLWVADACVKEHCRGEGYGKTLINHVKAFAKENNCSRIELNVWDFNKGARGFYSGLGMREQRHIMEFIVD
ncbi:MAG: GNAT family N-acetyltransferase [Oscillospiraceae bacterium]|nr:GNAT family N-acetyltransferase [Oscillospiraceae bacterium]